MHIRSDNRAPRGFALAAVVLTTMVWLVPTANAQSVRTRTGIEVDVAAGRSAGGRVVVTTGVVGRDRTGPGRAVVRERGRGVVERGRARQGRGGVLVERGRSRHGRGPVVVERRFGRHGRIDRRARHVGRGVGRGIYEVRRERVWVPGCAERVWVTPVHEWHVLPCGTRQRVLVQAGYYRTIRRPGYYKWVTRRVFVPHRRGRWD